MRRTVGLITGGLLVVALAALAQNGADMDNFTFSDGTVCGLTGTAKSAAAKSLSRLKNRYDIPADADIEPTITLSAMLQPGFDDTRFQPTDAARITGYVDDVKFGGEKEVCNCGERLPADRDTHIEIGLSPDAPPTERVIVEVTPRLRALLKQQGVDWSTATLQGQDPSNPGGGIKGKWVEVTGWMMFDTMHVAEAENTNPGHPGNWRATCWEIHPITSIRVLSGPPAAPAGHPTFRAFAGSVTSSRAKAHRRLSAATRKKYQARSQRLLAKFPPEDRENDNR
jgi:hypothetical protein